MKKNRNIKILIPNIAVLLTLLFALCLSMPAMADDEGYEMTDATTKWTRHQAGNAYFETSGPYDLFTGVMIDGAEIMTGSYDASGGNDHTHISLYEDYLESLVNGQHTISICYSNGSQVTGTFGTSDCDLMFCYDIDGQFLHRVTCNNNIFDCKEACTDEDGNLCEESGKNCVYCGQGSDYYVMNEWTKSWNIDEHEDEDTAHFSTEIGFDSFTGVMVDGIEIAAVVYDAYGSDEGTSVDLHAAYMNSLEPGQHTMSICDNSDDKVTVVFNIAHDCDVDFRYFSGSGYHYVICGENTIHSRQACTDADGELCVISGKECVYCGWYLKDEGEDEDRYRMTAATTLCVLGRSDNAEFETNIPYENFTGVMIDGSMVSADSDADDHVYDADGDEDSTHVRLFENYWESLTAGRHIISICYNDGTCVTGIFTVDLCIDLCDWSSYYVSTGDGRHNILCIHSIVNGEEDCTDEDGNLCWGSGKACTKCGWKPEDEDQDGAMPSPESTEDPSGTSDETSTQEQTESTSAETTTETTTAAATTASTATSASTATQAATTNRTSTNTTSNTVKTGDRSNVSLYIIMALVATGIGGFVVRKLVRRR